MENLENKIENSIKHAIPPRSLFEQTMNLVTKDEFVRNTVMKDEKPSENHKKYFTHFKKFTYIGLPTLALTAYLLFAYMPLGSRGMSENMAIYDAIEDVSSSISSEVEIDSGNTVDDEAEYLINNEMTEVNSIKTNTYEKFI